MTPRQQFALLWFVWFAIRANKGDEFNFAAGTLALLGALWFLMDGTRPEDWGLG